MTSTPLRLNFGRSAIAIPPETSDEPPSEEGRAVEAPVLPLPPDRKHRQGVGSRAEDKDVPNPLIEEFDDEKAEDSPDPSSRTRALDDEVTHHESNAEQVEEAVERLPQLGKSGRGKNASRRPSGFLLTVEHLEVLRWTDKARYTSNEQVAVYLDKDLRRTRKMLGKLERYGYLKRKQYAGYPTAYFLTESSKDLLASNTRAVEEATGPGFIRHTLAVGWVMLGLLKGQVPWAKSAEKLLGRAVRLDDFVSESEVVRSAHRRWGEIMTMLERNAKDSGQKTYVKKWEAWDALREEVAEDEWPVATDENSLYFLAAYGWSGKPHYPDLLLLLPDLVTSDGKRSPRAVAIEVERSYKPGSVDDILRSYTGEIGTRYAQCVWLCGDERVRDLVKEKVETRGLKGHLVQLASVSKNWKVAYLAELEAQAQQSKTANAAARDRGAWHVTSDLRVAECRCGTTCRARFGSHPNRSAADSWVAERGQS